MNDKIVDSNQPLKNKGIKRRVMENQKSCSIPQFDENMMMDVDTPSCSACPSENYIAMIDPKEMEKVTDKINKVLDECSKGKEEIKVDRFIFEVDRFIFGVDRFLFFVYCSLMSKTLGDYCNKYDPLSYALETKLREKCQALEAKRISTNRIAFDLKQQIEGAKLITKTLIDENKLFNRGYIRRGPLPDTIVRSVSVQVGDGVCPRKKFKGLPVLPYQKKVLRGDTTPCSKEPPYYSGLDITGDESSENPDKPGCSSWGTSFEGSSPVLVKDKSTMTTQCRTGAVKKVPVKKKAAVEKDLVKQKEFSSVNIKVRSPQMINEEFSKQSENTPTSVAPTPVSLYNLPKYPPSPRYPASVPKPPAPILTVVRDKTFMGKLCVKLIWDYNSENKPEDLVAYELYAFCPSFPEPIYNKAWRKIGNIKAISLPMFCFFTAVQEEKSYNFIIRAVDNMSRIGEFSLPTSIFLSKTG